MLAGRVLGGHTPLLRRGGGEGKGTSLLGLSIFSNMAGLCSVLSHRPSVRIESQSQQPWRRARISSNRSLGMSSAWSKIPELVGEGPGV